MATVKYKQYRNTKAGLPSVYCRVQQHQVITFDDICRHDVHLERTDGSGRLRR